MVLRFKLKFKLVSLDSKVWSGSVSLDDPSLHLVPGDESGVVGVHGLEPLLEVPVVSSDGGIGVSLGLVPSDDSRPALGPGEESGVVGVGHLEESGVDLEHVSLSVGVEGVGFLNLSTGGEGDHTEKGDVLEHLKL